jgi:hypothetical protein
MLATITLAYLAEQYGLEPEFLFLGTFLIDMELAVGAAAALGGRC